MQYPVWLTAPEADAQLLLLNVHKMAQVGREQFADPALKHGGAVPHSVSSDLTDASLDRL